MLGSFAGFVHGHRPGSANENMEMFYMVIRELAPFVDVIAYHPFYQPTVNGKDYLEYIENVKWFKGYCKDKGFTGNRYIAGEFAVGAMYPPIIAGTPSCWWGENGAVIFSEVQKAKILLQLNIRHTALGIQSFICELFNHDYPLELPLLRKESQKTKIKKQTI